jgi:predicted 2-oxoglutarate/Fe(II)-dependent dioxygenase YbiX
MAMFKPPSIFVQIPAYRDVECAPTLANMFAEAAKPERIFVGICWQYKLEEDEASPNLPEKFAKQIRITTHPVSASRGVSWARYEAQKLYQNETYTLMIDSHMRFAKRWDEILITQLKNCDSKKAVITCHPPEYAPPNVLQTSAKPTVIRAHTANAAGDIRLRGEALDRTPVEPVRGAFASPACIFASGKLVAEVPSDPHLYFEQEEMCYSARLFTHGWDVFHPTAHAVYHLYDTTPVPFARRKHWEDYPDWNSLNLLAIERRNHLLGAALAKTDAALLEIEKFGLGRARSLEQYAEFCGIDFSNMNVKKRALTCGFIPDLKRYRDAPITPPLSPTVMLKPTAAPHQDIRIPSPYINIPVSAFTPVHTDLFSTPIYQPTHVAARSGKAPALITDGVPAGVLLVENYASPELCKYLIEYSERTLGTKLKVVDAMRSTADNVVSVESENRRTESVSINEIAGEILSIFIDIYTQRLAPFYGVKFEWFERPQILRYRAGGRYDPHADADDLDPITKQWMRVHDRDISVLLYLNDNYEGGKLSFESLGFSIQPKAGMLIAFPSDHRYLHAAKPTTAGIRYVIVSWSTYLKSLRIKNMPPYGSVVLNNPADC